MKKKKKIYVGMDAEVDMSEMKLCLWDSSQFNKIGQKISSKCYQKLDSPGS